MTQPRSFLKPILGVALTIVLALVIYARILAAGPEMDLKFSRDVPSRASVPALGAQLADFSKWPDWFFSLKEAYAVSATGEPLPKAQQTIFEGERVRLFIEPKMKQWKRFQIDAVVEAYRPNDFLRLRILNDSKGKLSELFEDLVWQINLMPNPTQALAKNGAPNLSVIRGTVTARGINWRAKFFGKLTPTILMAQVFYPDLIKLSETGFAEPKSGLSFSGEGS